MQRRHLLQGLAAGAGIAAFGRAARAATPGVTESEIRIGCTQPLSGPASAYGIISRTEAAYFGMVNEQGGFDGRRINFIVYDDGYSPPRTVEMVRKLVEDDKVAFLFQTLGTANNTAIRQYCNDNKVPQLSVATGAEKFSDYQHFPWTTPGNASYRSEAQIYAKYIARERPQGKVAVLYQNDDLGKDYVSGLKSGFGDAFDRFVIKTATYEVTDPTIDSQIATLQASGADVMVTIATPKFGAMAIRKIAEVGWKPLHIIGNVASSVGAVIKPAGMENAVGLVTAIYGKDPTDRRWANDAGMNLWRAFMAKYMPGTDLSDLNTVYGYGQAFTMTHVLRQCGTDFSRENILRQATNIRNLESPTLLPDIRINMSPTDYHPVRQFQLERFSGRGWELFGEVIET
ncbi:MAG TPA: ABC transporter substrate-binding protein [Acetobacteraceae bacterium]|nr:ABC transporter substrate-binding protein [Acetobacteraceae bacterium]